ncbi:hypothetical protein N657DRAFT_396199 [Parathielavia appendiculata]|uniref:Uncharacterized protein n=1 Tax=Parathielavia appendiculata TaxID=2587402 RepID=A0AAN6U182_9PEZI|nr:hypothetical protein N657DRAFT_396199 [Parathielavia appendiculata]
MMLYLLRPILPQRQSAVAKLNHHQFILPIIRIPHDVPATSSTSRVQDHSVLVGQPWFPTNHKSSWFLLRVVALESTRLQSIATFSIRLRMTVGTLVLKPRIGCLDSRIRRVSSRCRRMKSRSSCCSRSTKEVVKGNGGSGLFVSTCFRLLTGSMSAALECLSEVVCCASLPSGWGKGGFS